MRKLLCDVHVFIASPSGLDNERQAVREVLQEHNDLDPRNRQVIFTAVGWEETLAGCGTRPQDFINEDLITCDYFVLILSDRWGSPPGNGSSYSSGSEEEFHLAMKCLEDSELPMREVLVFFKDVPAGRLRDPGEQLRKVLKFKTDLEQSKQHLYRTFTTIPELQKRLRKHLARWSRDAGQE